MPYLKSDIVGTASRMTFGKKGDLVSVFTDHDNVKIVENQQGLRFSVRDSDLSKEKIEPDVDKIIIPKKKK